MPSKNLVQFLTLDVDYINALHATTTISPEDFYKGLNPGFAAVEQNLDARRNIADEILSDVFLADAAHHADRLELLLLKAHADYQKQGYRLHANFDTVRPD